MMENGRGTLVPRAALVGQVIRTWRRRREANRQDAFVKAWKAAWTEGCHHRWGSGLRDDVPYAQEDQRAAWLAGWQWADTNPDRRRQGGPPARGYRRSTDGRARLVRGASRGAAGLAVLAVARWWWRRRGIARPEPTAPQEHGDD